MHGPDLLTLLEGAATLMTALCVVLAARRHITTWPVGIIASALYMRLFFDTQLYADATLQLFFMATGLWGWRIWLQAAHTRHPEQAPPLPRLTVRQGLALLALGLGMTLAYGALLAHWTQAYAPFWDSAVLATSVIAQWLLMQGRRETWPCWILVNTLSVPLYLSRGLHLTAALYTLLWLNAWHGWWVWRKARA
jgi:nicotinamide mononucleotide transporter